MVGNGCPRRLAYWSNRLSRPDILDVAAALTIPLMPEETTVVRCSSPATEIVVEFEFPALLNDCLPKHPQCHFG